PVVVLELPTVDDVGLAITVVVDVDVVERAVRERVEVGTARRLLERDPVADEGDRVRLVRADERVQVGPVGLWIRRDQGGLAMARCPARVRPQAGQQADAQGPDGRYRDPRLPKSL